MTRESVLATAFQELREAPRVVRLTRIPSARSRAVFFRALASMYSAGIPLHRGLEQLAEGADEEAMRMVVSLLSRDLQRGRTLAAAMRACSRAFSPMHASMVRMGEETGRLADVLESLALYEERKEALGMRVRSALTYPCFLAVLCLLGAVLAPPFVLEGHFQMIRQSHLEPPFLTRAVMAFSAALRQPWVYIAVFLAAAGAVKLWRRAEPMRRAERLLRVPYFGRLYRALSLTRMMRSLALTLKGGTRLDVALTLAGEATGCPYFSARMAGAATDVINGRPLVRALRKTTLFPRTILDMVAAGEQVGEVPRMCEWMAHFAEEEVERSLEVVTSFLEPAIMVGMGAVVGVLVLATMQPMVQVLQTL